MSMSDLELLQLVDTVKEKQRGPKGEPGVGIEKVEQFDETGFTLRLTDGSFKKIDLPTPKDGEAGQKDQLVPAVMRGLMVAQDEMELREHLGNVVWMARRDALLKRQS